MQDKTDKHKVKFANTAKKMQEALLAILNKKQFSEITVSDICSHAGVNRSTFYAHYEAVRDLLEETERVTMARFEQSGVYKPTEAELKNDSAKVLFSDKILLPFLNFIKENKILFRAVFQGNALFQSKNYYEHLRFNIMPLAYKMPPEKFSEKEMDYIASYFINGFLAILGNWTHDGCTLPVERICSILRSCAGVSAQG